MFQNYLLKMGTVVTLLMGLFINIAWHAAPKFKYNVQMKTIDQFKQIITGNFDNQNQVLEEIKAGQQIHPLAKHVNRLADSKIINLPNDLNGFFILEESYYDYPGKPTEVKPYLFKFTDAGNGKVQLTVYQFPAGLDKKDIRNDNAKLQFDYHLLQPSPNFKGAIYELRADGCFYTNTTNELPNGMKFTLIEKLCNHQLQVMELLEKDGKRISPYDSPILYDRK